MNLDTNIGWCTHTHNDMTGCLHLKLGICLVDRCYAQQTAENPYYARAFPYKFTPHFYPERLYQPGKLKTPAIIFMDSMSDSFGDWWPEEFIVKVLHTMDTHRGFHWHKFVVLTKNPARMVDILSRYNITDGADRLSNTYFGTSIIGLLDQRELDRVAYLEEVHDLGYKTVMSCEPLLHNPIALRAFDLSWLDWMLVGGQTKPVIEPPFEWIANLPKIGGPVFIKDNSGLKNLDRSKMFPADLLPIAQRWKKA